MTLRAKGCPRFYNASLVLKQLIFIFFFIKLGCFGSNLFFEKYRTTNNYKKRGHRFVDQCFVKLFKKFQGKRGSSSGTGEHGNLWFFSRFTSSSQLKFFWHSSFNLARSTCSFYWCYIFPFVIIFTKDNNTERKKIVIV